MEFSEAARDYERRAEPLELSDDGKNVYGSVELMKAFDAGLKLGSDLAMAWKFLDKEELPKLSKTWKVCSDDLMFVTASDNAMHYGYFNSEKKFEEYANSYSGRWRPEDIRCYCYLPDYPGKEKRWLTSVPKEGEND
jgi:hypothetical protein